jgi:Protein of unknown function (DUF2442)
MRTESNAEDHLSSDLEPPVVSSMPWRVTQVEVLANHRLRVTFRDGLTGIVDLVRRIHAPDAGVFAPLADPARFAEVTLEYGAVTWPGGIDLAPDAMHHALQQSPVWTP